MKSRSSMRYDSSCGPPVPTIARCARNLITLARSDEPSALAAIKEVADRMDGKTRQEAEVTLRNAVARELSDDDLAAIAIGSAHEESQEDRKSDPSKLN